MQFRANLRPRSQTMSHDNDDRQRAFYSHLHHALMNPLTVVIGYAELLAQRTDLAPSATLQAERIMREARTCIDIIEGARAGRLPAGPKLGTYDTSGDSLEKVLIVENDPEDRMIISDFLSPDFRVVSAESANTALRYLLTEDFAMVFVSYKLPGDISGREIWETLSIQQPEVLSKVVFMTPPINDDDDEEFLRTTGLTLMRKPLTTRSLDSTVQSLAKVSTKS